MWLRSVITKKYFRKEYSMQATISGNGKNNLKKNNTLLNPRSIYIVDTNRVNHFKNKYRTIAMATTNFKQDMKPADTDKFTSWVNSLKGIRDLLFNLATKRAVLHFALR